MLKYSSIKIAILKIVEELTKDERDMKESSTHDKQTFFQGGQCFEKGTLRCRLNVKISHRLTSALEILTARIGT